MGERARRRDGLNADAALPRARLLRALLRRRIRRALRSHHRHIADAEARRPGRDAGVRRRRAVGRGARRRRGGDASPDLGRRRAKSGDPIAAALGTEIASAPKLAVDRLSLLARRLWRPRRRLGRRDRDDDPGARARRRAGSPPSRPGRRSAGKRGVPVAVLRLAGIYGPGQNVFTRLLAGRAHRVAKPGHVFNRIHVADIAQAIDAAFAQQGRRRLQRHRRRARGLFRSGADGGETARHRSAEGTVDGGGAAQSSRRWRSASMPAACG